jgi:hypothetical protein
MPPYTPTLDLSLVSAAKELAVRWKSGSVAGASPADLSAWTTTQKSAALALPRAIRALNVFVVVFLDELLDGELPAHSTVLDMDKAYGLSAVRNAEIRLRWQVRAGAVRMCKPEV